MAEKQKPEIERPTPNGEHGAESREQESRPGSSETEGRKEDTRRRQLEDLTATYERARDELNQTVRNVREELAKIDFDKARERTRSWIEANPVLAVALGIGAGIVAGRLLADAFRTPPLSTRARRRAGALASQAGDVAGDVGETIAHLVEQARRSAGDAGGYIARNSADVADRMGRRARDLGEDVSRVTDRTVDVLEDAAEDLAHALHDKSKKVRKGAGKQLDRGFDFSAAALNVARTAIAAVVMKKAAGWLRSVVRS